MSSKRRYTIDDIAAHEWTNYGYKRLPIDVNVTAKMDKIGHMKSSHSEGRSHSQEAPRTTSVSSRNKLKSVQLSVPMHSVSPPDIPPVTVPQPLLKTWNVAYTDPKLKSIINGNDPYKQSNKIKDNKTKKSKKTESSKTNQLNKRTFNTKTSGSVSSAASSIRPPPMHTVIY